MRSRLLRGPDFADLYAAGTLDRLLGRLADTSYAPDVEAAVARATGIRRLDEAIRRNLARTLAAMHSFYAEDAADRVAVLLDRWVLHDLRTLFRVPDGPDAPEVSTLLIPAGRLDESALAALAALPDLRSRVDLAVSWELPSRATARQLRDALGDFERTANRAVVEWALNAGFAAKLDEILGNEVSRGAQVLRTEIDVANLVTALRLRAARLAGEIAPATDRSPIVPGGTRKIGHWEELAAEDDSERLAARVEELFPMPEWQEVLQAWSSHGQLTVLAGGLQQRLTAAALAGFAAGDPLGFDIPVAFTFAKEAEVRDLRLVGRGIVHGMDEAEVLARIETAA